MEEAEFVLSKDEDVMEKGVEFFNTHPDITDVIVSLEDDDRIHVTVKVDGMDMLESLKTQVKLEFDDDVWLIA